MIDDMEHFSGKFNFFPLSCTQNSSIEFFAPEPKLLKNPSNERWIESAGHEKVTHMQLRNPILKRESRSNHLPSVFLSS